MDAVVKKISDIHNLRLQQYAILDQALVDYLPPSRKISHDHYASLVGNVTELFRGVSISFIALKDGLKDVQPAISEPILKNAEELFGEIQKLEKAKLELTVDIHVLKADSALGFRDYTEKIIELSTE
ncbi:hypothetical protein HK096_009698 [Nowakowskiella sp. JEL0078]|nr:hypothetical protein HK096_009698 [Nowakowskiella sp. JEL0078]